MSANKLSYDKLVYERIAKELRKKRTIRESYE